MSYTKFDSKNFDLAVNILNNLVPNGIYVFVYGESRTQKGLSFYFCSKFEFKKLSELIKTESIDGFPKKGKWRHSSAREFFSSVESTNKLTVSEELIDSLIQTETLNQTQNVQNRKIGLLPVVGLINPEILRNCFTLMLETIIARLTISIVIPGADSNPEVQKQSLHELMMSYRGLIPEAYHKFFIYFRDETILHNWRQRLGGVIEKAYGNFFKILLESQLTHWFIDMSITVDFASICDWMTGCLRNTKLTMSSGLKLLIDSLIAVKVRVGEKFIPLISEECIERYTSHSKEIEVQDTPELVDSIIKVTELSKSPYLNNQLKSVILSINEDYGILKAEIVAEIDLGDSEDLDQLNHIISSMNEDSLLKKIFENHQIDSDEREAALVKLESILFECMQILTGDYSRCHQRNLLMSVSTLIRNLNVQVDKELQISSRANSSMSENDKLLKLRYISTFSKVCYQRIMTNGSVATKNLSDAISTICSKLNETAFKNFIDFSLGISNFMTTNNLNAKTISDLVGRIRGYFLESYYMFYKEGRDEDCSKQKNLRMILKETNPDLDTRALFKNSAFSLLRTPDDYYVRESGEVTLVELGWAFNKQEKGEKDRAKWTAAKDILAEQGIALNVKSFVVDDNIENWAAFTNVITNYEVVGIAQNFIDILKTFQTMRKITLGVLSSSSQRLDRDFSKFPNIKIVKENNTPSITEKDIEAARDLHIGPILSRLPESSHEWMESWIKQTNDLKVIRTVEEGSEQFVQESSYVDVKGKSMLLCGTLEEEGMIDLIDEMSNSSCRYEECSEEAARVVVQKWKDENKKKSEYNPSFDPGLQVPIPECSGPEKRDSLPKFLKRHSIFNLILSEVPFPKKEFKGVGKDDLMAFKKYTRRMASEDSMALGLNKIIGRNSKVNLIRPTSHVLSKEQLLLYQNYCSEFIGKKLTGKLAKMEVTENSFSCFTSKEKKCELEELKKTAKKLNKEIEVALSVINPIWNMSSAERIEELDRRCENSDYQAAKGEMIRPKVDDLTNIGEFIVWLKKELPESSLDFVEESLTSLILEETVLETFKRSDTLTEICCDVIRDSIKLISKYRFSEVLLLLKDIGDAFIKCKTESLTSGKFFIIDLNHFPVQMVVCMTSNSTSQSDSQMCCLVSDGRFFSLNCRRGIEEVSECSHRFYMDLRLAKLYESLFAQLLSVSLLICQTERKIKLKEQHDLEETVHLKLKTTDKVELFDTDELEECMCEVFSSCLMFTAKNDKNANEMIQNYRYVIMTFLNDFVSPEELGKKLSVNTRSTVAYEMMLRVQKACVEWGKLREFSHLEDFLRPMSFNHPINFPSITRNCCLKSIHSVISEMYLVHIFCIDGSSLANSTVKVFNKSLESQIDFEKEVEKTSGTNVVLGNDLCLTGEEFKENCKSILNCPSSVCSFSGKAMHDCGLLLNRWLKDCERTPNQDSTKLNVGFSTLSGTTSIVKKPMRTIDLDDCRISVRKQEIIRYIKVSRLNESNKEIEEKVKQVTKNFPSTLNFDSVNFTRSYLKNNSQTYMTNQEIEDFFARDFGICLPDYQKSVVCLKWLTKQVNKTRNKETESLGKKQSQIGQISKKLSGIVNQPSTTSYNEDAIPDVSESEKFLQQTSLSYTGLNKETLSNCFNQCIERIREVATLEYRSELKRAEEEFLKIREKQQRMPHLTLDAQIREKSLTIDSLVNKIADPLLKLLFMENSMLYSRYTLKQCDEGCVNIPGEPVLIALKKHIGKMWKALSSCFSLPLKILSEFVNNANFFEVLTRGSTLNIDEKGRLNDSVYLGLNFHIGMDSQTLWRICLSQLVEVSNQRLEESLSNHNLKKKFWQISTSLRTKVILELIDQALQRGGLGGEFNSSIQMVAEELITTKEMEFFGIAPKEQLGSIRELGIQSFKTKLTNHMSEMIARTVNKKISSFELTESLSHQDAKYYKVDDAITEIKESKIKERESAALREGRLYEGYCFALNKDHSKWGPTHCPGGNFRFFLHGLGDATGKFKDYMDLKMISGSSKDVEIPRSVIVKQAKLPRSVKFESESDKLKAKTREILESGKQVVGKYQDMIQGIHHHFSSTNAMGVQLMCHRWMKKLFLRHAIEIGMSTTQGSDDELSLLIVLSIVQDSELSESRKETFAKKAIEAYRLFEKLLNFKTSPKSTYGTIIVEFNQIFSIYEANIPTCIKYCTSQFYPLNCTNWNELVSMIYSSCQQALYMGVPYLNIVLIALKQYSYYTKLTLMGKNGRNNLPFAKEKLPSCLGGIRVPSRSNLLSDDLSSLELREVVSILSEEVDFTWLLNFFDPAKSDADIAEFLDKGRSPFRVNFKRLELNELRRARIRLFAAKSSIEEEKSVETPLSFFRKNVETLRTPLNYEADLNKMINVVSSYKIENSFIEKSTASNLRMMKALYRGNYACIGNDTFLSFTELIKKAMDLEVPTQLRDEFQEFQQSMTRTDVTGRSETLKQLTDQENKTIKSCTIDESDRCCWKSISVSSTQVVIESEPAAVLELCVVDDRKDVTVQGSVKIQTLENDVETAKELCRLEIETLSDAVRQEKLTEELKDKIVLLSKRLMSILKKAKPRRFKIFSVGERTDTERLFIESMLSRNTIRGLNFNLRLAEFGVVSSNKQQNLKKLLGIVCLILKLVNSMEAVNFLKLINNDPSIVGLPGQSLKVELTTLMLNPNLKMQTKQQALSVLSLLGDQTANQLLLNSINQERDGTKVSNRGKTVVITTCQKDSVAQSFVTDEGSIHFSTSFNVTFLNTHFINVKIELTKAVQQSTYPEEMLTISSTTDIGLTQLERTIYEKKLSDEKDLLFFKPKDGKSLRFKQGPLTMLGTENFENFVVKDPSLKMMAKPERKIKENTSITTSFDGQNLITTYLDVADMSSQESRLLQKLELKSSLQSYSTSVGKDTRKEVESLEKMIDSLKRAIGLEIDTKETLLTCRLPVFIPFDVAVTFIEALGTKSKTLISMTVASRKFVEPTGDIAVSESPMEESDDSESSISTSTLRTIVDSARSDAVSEKVVEKKGFPEVGASTLDSLDDKRIFSQELSKEFLERATKEEVEGASYFLRRVEEDREITKNEWSERDAIITAGTLNGVTFEEMSNMSRGETEGLRNRVSWEMFFRRRGFKSSSLDFVRPTMVLFEVKFPKAGNWLYEIFSLMTNRDEFSFSRMCMLLPKKTSQISEMIDHSLEKAGRSNPTRSAETVSLKDASGSEADFDESVDGDSILEEIDLPSDWAAIGSDLEDDLEIEEEYSIIVDEPDFSPSWLSSLLAIEKIDHHELKGMFEVVLRTLYVANSMNSNLMITPYTAISSLVTNVVIRPAFGVPSDLGESWDLSSWYFNCDFQIINLKDDKNRMMCVDLATVEVIDVTYTPVGLKDMRARSWIKRTSEKFKPRNVKSISVSENFVSLKKILQILTIIGPSD